MCRPKPLSDSDYQCICVRDCGDGDVPDDSDYVGEWSTESYGMNLLRVATSQFARIFSMVFQILFQTLGRLLAVLTLANEIASVSSLVNMREAISAAVILGSSERTVLFVSTGFTSTPISSLFSPSGFVYTAVPTLRCEPDKIVLSISQSFVEEYDMGLNNSFVSVSPSLQRSRFPCESKTASWRSCDLNAG